MDMVNIVLSLIPIHIPVEFQQINANTMGVMIKCMSCHLHK